MKAEIKVSPSFVSKAIKALEEKIDGAIIVADSSSLERSLYLVNY